MRTEECIKTLLDASVSIEEKLEWLEAYIDWHESLGRNMGIGVVAGRSSGIMELLGALPKEEKDAEQKLRNTLAEIKKYRTQIKQERDAKVKALAARLHSLNPGDAIVISNQSREDLVRFLEMKRTRFICEYPDGRRCSVPVQLFLRVHKGEAPSQLSDEEARKRELVRTLAGRYFEGAREEILKENGEMLPALLAELAAAMQRIENAPVGLSGGVLSGALGPIKKINPRDQALTKRIPSIITEIAVRIGKEKVVKLVEEYRNAAVQACCKKALSNV